MMNSFDNLNRGRSQQYAMRSRLFVVTMLAVLMATGMQAQAPATYYNTAHGKSGAPLKTELHQIIKSGYVDKGYSFLYAIFVESDSKSDGTVWDMYSTCTFTHNEDNCGSSIAGVCHCYNREHTIPQSWFNERYPMRSDAHHVYPTDGDINGKRASFPYGECSNGESYNKGLGKKGTSTFLGYSGTVFEPVDEYKGDFARTYFYFVTRYEDLMSTFSTSSTSFSGNTYPSLNSWSIALFLKWHRQDPVSEKEIVRNNAVYKYQKNRNAFVDHPILAEHIWGTLQGSAWDVTGVETPAELMARVNFNANERSMMVAADLDELRYEVVSISGVRVMSGTLMGGDAVSMASLKPGVYFFRVNADSLKAVKKFIVH